MHLYTISRLTQDIQYVLYTKMWNTLRCFNFTICSRLDNFNPANIKLSQIL